jgi:N-acetylglucosaminyldiphosphoundecaprenol N-acetyl-beta-D-mannosaminyltransferase
MQRVDICSIMIDNLTFDEAIKAINAMIKKKSQSYVVTPNVDHIIKLQTNQRFRQIYDKANLILADGKPLLWASVYLGTPLKEKISGSDLVPRLCKLAADMRYKVFFLGGRPRAALIAADVIKRLHPCIEISGTYCPAFGFENDLKENTYIVNMIRKVSPDILFVGLGAPKQEEWIFRYKEYCEVPVSIGVGATFEFISGLVKRAPVWMQRVGLEWFWRLISEPRRLWKRYLVDDMKFIWLVYRQRKSLKQ